MGKLGGKARKFAKKNLQSVLKRKRKLKSVFKKKSNKRGGIGTGADTEGIFLNPHKLNGRSNDTDDIQDTRLDALYSESDSDSGEDDSGSDDDGATTRCADEKHAKLKGLLKKRTVDSFCECLEENYDAGAFLKLVNAYRTACHYGDEPSCDSSSQALTKVVIFMLSEADNIFRRVLGKESVTDLKKNSNWETLRPLLKSYLRSTLHLLQQVAEPEMITFTVVKLRSSATYFSSFPYLLKRLIKISTHLWVTCPGNTSQQAFLLIQEIAEMSNLKWFDLCFSEAYKKYINHCHSDDPSLFDHTHFVKNSLVNLCSTDIHGAYTKAFKSVRVIRNCLLLATKSNNKEAVKRLSSWQYINCIDLWVTFVSTYASDYDLHLLIRILVEVINTMALLFSGPRYLPLRINCVKWLNNISNSSGAFIPVISLVLSILDYKIVKGEKNSRQELHSLSSTVKLPKNWIKSNEFQEACLFSVIHLLAMHFLQWSFHISFPELATFPIIRLKSYLDFTSLDSSKRVVKRFIDQVEQNVNFVLKKREEVAFSPNDQQAADSFLQLEKNTRNSSFVQYYRSLLEKASQKSLMKFK